MNHCKIFGCKAFVYVHKRKWQQFDEMATEGIFDDYNSRSKGYRIYIGKKSDKQNRDLNMILNIFPKNFAQ